MRRRGPAEKYWNVTEETEEERGKRRRQRLLFDGIAANYDATRHGYDSEVVDVVFATAELKPGDPVLEVGCGTGQLTVALAQRGVALAAIDIGPTMIRLATRRVAPYEVHLRTCAYEDLDAPDGSYKLIVSGTAFHWIDPNIAWRKSAALLRPGGWMAILSTAERYDDPIGAAYREQWIRYSEDGGAWAATPRPTLAETISSTELFEPAVTHVHRERRTMPAETVVGLEQTRATTLSFDIPTRAAFVEDLRQLLATTDLVSLTQETSLTMARLAGS